MSGKAAAPATKAQLAYLKDLGVESIPDGITNVEASDWIDEVKEYRRAADHGTIPEGKIRTDLFQNLKGRGKAPIDTTARPVDQPSEPQPATQPVQYEDDTGPGTLTPVTALAVAERNQLGKFETRVIEGTSYDIIPEVGFPARFVFARIGKNRRSGTIEVRLFPGIEALTWRANAFHKGIQNVSFEYLDPAAIPGLAGWTAETKDPQIIARAHVVLGDGREATDEGTVRQSEAVMWGRRPSVVRNYPLEMAKKRALARALRWATGYAGTTAEEVQGPD